MTPTVRSRRGSAPPSARTAGLGGRVRCTAGQMIRGSKNAISTASSTASTAISFVRDLPWLELAFAGPLLGAVLFVVWSNLITTATTNAVNLTDGLDGLATGATAMVTGA